MEEMKMEESIVVINEGNIEKVGKKIEIYEKKE